MGGKEADAGSQATQGHEEALSVVDAAAQTILVDPTQFYDDLYRPTLGALALVELARSGPLRLDRLAQRIARRHGFQRTGPHILDRVAASIPETCQRTEDSAGIFVWPDGADPAVEARFRPPAPGLSIDPADVPIEALALLARDCIARHTSQEAALIAMRDACGLARLREVSRERLLEALGRRPASPSCGELVG